MVEAADGSVVSVGSIIVAVSVGTSDEVVFVGKTSPPVQAVPANSVNAATAAASAARTVRRFDGVGGRTRRLHMTDDSTRRQTPVRRSCAHCRQQAFDGGGDVPTVGGLCYEVDFETVTVSEVVQLEWSLGPGWLLAQFEDDELFDQR